MLTYGSPNGADHVELLRARCQNNAVFHRHGLCGGRLEPA